MNLKFWEQRRAPIVATSAAREAMGITDPAMQGFAAVALAVGQGAVLHDPAPAPESAPVSEVAERNNRLAHLKRHGPTSEYHLALATGVMGELLQDEKRIEADLSEHERVSAEISARLREELADTRKSMTFWRTAPDHLAPELPAPAPKPKRARLPKPTPKPTPE